MKNAKSWLSKILVIGAGAVCVASMSGCVVYPAGPGYYHPYGYYHYGYWGH